MLSAVMLIGAVGTVVAEEIQRFCTEHGTDEKKAFDPVAMQKIEEKHKDEGRLGLRLVFGMAQDVQYQNIFGLNILTVRI